MVRKLKYIKLLLENSKLKQEIEDVKRDNKVEALESRLDVIESVLFTPNSEEEQQEEAQKGIGFK